MWMGGKVPLDYDCVDRLVVNQGEAEVVREIVRKYLSLASVRELKEFLGSAADPQ
jgi:site-specific DNA recombinase